MDYKIQHIPISPNTRSGAKAAMSTITIHSTANPKSTAENERNWLVNPTNNRVASWHIAVDENGAVEAIPLNEKAWHASSTKGNNTSIGIEICESGNRQKTVENTIRLVAKMLHERHWTVAQLRRHYDWSGKICPRIFSANNWAEWAKFKNDVNTELIRIKGVEKMAAPKSPANNTPSPWAKADVEWAKSLGLLDGTRPKDPLTREELAIVLHRFFNLKK